MEAYMTLNTETIEMIKTFDWIRTRPDIEPFAWHTANERKTSPQAGRLLKRMGVKAGIADIFIAIPNPIYHGLFIEMKVNNGKLSKEQRQFIGGMNSQGYMALCCYSYESARSEIENYIAMKSSVVYHPGFYCGY